MPSLEFWAQVAREDAARRRRLQAEMAVAFAGPADAERTWYRELEDGYGREMAELATEHEAMAAEDNPRMLRRGRRWWHSVGQHIRYPFRGVITV